MNAIKLSLLTILISVSIINAQDTLQQSSSKSKLIKGNTLIGLWGNYSNNSSENDIFLDNSSKIKVIPSIQYFITNKFSGIIGIGYLNQHSEFGNKLDVGSTVGYTEKNSNYFGIMPSIRYYDKISKKVYFYIFIECFLGVGKTNISYISNKPTKSYSEDSQIYFSNLGIGISIPIYKVLIFETSCSFINIEGYKNSYLKSNNKTTNLDINYRPNIGFGFRLKIK